LQTSRPDWSLQQDFERKGRRAKIKEEKVSGKHKTEGDTLSTSAGKQHHTFPFNKGLLGLHSSGVYLAACPSVSFQARCCVCFMVGMQSRNVWALLFTNMTVSLD